MLILLDFNFFGLSLEEDLISGSLYLTWNFEVGVSLHSDCVYVVIMMLLNIFVLLLNHTAESMKGMWWTTWTFGVRR